ncbi:hypothetical protein NE237_029776 [Protea cynaroides]|uniref:Uncharacterized protein n=1 Tax=Protea cynaroides TaxID=273540 RepID=A0A9Q0GWH2_9MAGN|nr:hypothetical protein NE237_029776 [Protea cynaroides]
MVEQGIFYFNHYTTPLPVVVKRLSSFVYVRKEKFFFASVWEGQTLQGRNTQPLVEEYSEAELLEVFGPKAVSLQVPRVENFPRSPTKLTTKPGSTMVLICYSDVVASLALKGVVVVPPEVLKEALTDPKGRKESKKAAKDSGPTASKSQSGTPKDSPSMRVTRSTAKGSKRNNLVAKKLLPKENKGKGRLMT